MALTLVLILCGGRAAIAQDRYLFEQVEIAITNLEQESILEHKTLEKTFAGYVWRPKAAPAQDYLFMMITAHQSSEWARVDFESNSETTRMHGGIDMKVLAEKVSGLGDDNYRWEIMKSKERGLNFRKGRYHISVSARSFDEAERIARYIVGIFPDA